MTPQAFIAHWQHNQITERAGAQQHFNDLCEMLGMEKPRDAENYCFERGAKTLGGQGWADVWKRGCFAWEYKAPNKDLNAALKQLMNYALALDNPPLLVVSDLRTIEIHTHFTGHPSEVHRIEIEQLTQPETLQKLRWLFDEPERFKPKNTTYAVTELAAKRIGEIATRLNQRGNAPDDVAHFLIQCVFCMFAEDAKLLPEKLFETVMDKSNPDGSKAQKRLSDLFNAMQSGGDFHMTDIPWFNGGLFKQINIPALETADVVSLLEAARMDWSQIEPAILGTLFERGLNPDMRSQLGAHYTDPATIMKIIRPVIEQPLLTEWQPVKVTIAENMQKYEAGGKGSKNAYEQAQQAFIQFLQRLRDFRVLDPACGSGNFLYLALKTLKDLEHRINIEAEALGLHRELNIETSPANVMGIEINPYAAELARVTVWIGEIQWMLSHGYQYRKNPILAPLDHIENRDAILQFPSPNGRGARGEGVMSETIPSYLIDYARELRINQTDAENLMWGLLRDRRFMGFKFRRQHPLVPYILDFYCHELKLCIELDGGQHSVQTQQDQKRDQFLQTSGIRVLRFWNNDVLANTNSVLEAIYLAISSDTLTPTPLPKGEGQVHEAEWPAVDAIVGNPPFLGGSKKRRELGDAYFDALSNVYKTRVPDGADLVCYWFEKARAHIAKGLAKYAGLVSTNSIRGGANRKTLERILDTQIPSTSGRGAGGEGKLNIYNAWSDEAWVNNGAAVRVSLICFSQEMTDTSQTVTPAKLVLNGAPVAAIFSDLSGKPTLASQMLSVGIELIKLKLKYAEYDLTLAKPLHENAGASIRGLAKVGQFDVNGDLAREWLKQPNPNNRPNSDVLTPWANGMDITRRLSDTWLIDFANELTEQEASLFEAPFQYVSQNVKAERQKQQDAKRKLYWWRLGRSGEEVRTSLSSIKRFIATPMVAKYRLFVWLASEVFPDQQLIVIARDDDTTFGILHSRFHELWSLKMCTWMGKGNDPRYTPTTCFETFPFPQNLTPKDLRGSHPRGDANIIADEIASAAQRLNELRENWLNPTEWVDWVITPEEEKAGFPKRVVAKAGFEAELKKRTLTNLYNQRPAWLDNAHKTLDMAVAKAYGWQDYTPEMPDDEILQCLLKLNLERSQ